MAITLELTSEVESQVRQKSSKVGLTMNNFIAECIQAYLAKLDKPKSRTMSQPSRFSKIESNLLLKINQSLSQIEWAHYRDLIAKRQAETLTATEQDELIQISNEIEEKNAERITYVAELAQIHHLTLPTMMQDLGLKPVAYV